MDGERPLEVLHGAANLADVPQTQPEPLEHLGLAVAQAERGVDLERALEVVDRLRQIAEPPVAEPEVAEESWAKSRWSPRSSCSALARR